MTDLEWAAPAVADLTAILDYIAEDSPAAADALLDDIQTAASRLREHPARRRPGRMAETRELIVRRTYVLVYTQTASTVRIIRLLHAAQMWP